MNECISKSDYSATEKNIQTCEDMFTNDDVMSAKQAESHCNLKQVTCSRKGDESQINQTDWLIDWLILQQVYFIGSRYRISFIYRSNKNDNFHPYRSIIYLSDKYRASLVSRHGV